MGNHRYLGKAKGLFLSLQGKGRYIIHCASDRPNTKKCKNCIQIEVYKVGSRFG